MVSKKSTKSFTAAIIGALLLSPAVFAQSSLEMEKYLSNEIHEFDTAVAECAVEPSGGQASAEEAWYFKRFWLRVRPKVSFGIPGAKLEITPEVEMLWDRDYPQGWSGYKPGGL